MKILKKPDSNWSYKHTCIKCDAELEVEKSDVSMRHFDGDQREPSYDSFTAACPVCQDTFSIPENKIPKIVKVEMEQAKSKIYRNYWD